MSSLANVDVWLDEVKLLPGQDWHHEISAAIRASDVIVVCLSRNSISKEGYVQREIREALERAKEKPPGTIFLIPVRLEDCDVPAPLATYQYANLFEQQGQANLIVALSHRASKFGISIEAASSSVHIHSSERTQTGDASRSLGSDKLITMMITMIEQVRGISDPSDRARAASRAADAFQAIMPRGSSWGSFDDLQTRMAKNAFVALGEKEILALGTSPESYFPGVLEVLNEKQFVLNSMRFIQAFSDTLEQGCTLDQLAKTMLVSARGRPPLYAVATRADTDERH